MVKFCQINFLHYTGKIYKKVHLLFFVLSKNYNTVYTKTLKCGGGEETVFFMFNPA